MIRQGTAANVVTTLPAGDDWRHHAACREEKPDLFYGDKGDDALAKDTCQICPVRQACLDWALETKEPHGVWGGLDERERRALLRRGQPKPAPRPTPVAIAHGTPDGAARHKQLKEKVCDPCKAAAASAEGVAA